MPTRRRILQAACAALPAGLLSAAVRAADHPLNHRPIPSTGEMLPTVGMGTADTFDVNPQGADMAALEDVVKRLIAGAGKNAVIDTAPSYGQAEAVTGALLARLQARDGIFLATKIGTTGRDAALRQVRNSQAMLNSQRLDLIQVHNLIDTVNQLALLRELKQQGVTRYVGITHYTESAQDELTRLVEREKPDFLQINLSVTARGAEQRLLPACQAHGVAVLINRPFRDGALFRQVRDKPLPGWAAEIDCTSWAQVFLKFIIGHPAVTCVIPATSKPANMADNVLAGRGRLPDAAMRKRIADLFV
ncbi:MULTISPECIES: aldo/keto reductase [unclassified Achromobacter]|uniref:aldo/keto reductase n=1 Tax=unclassified Achromobacter TaxID=2626865 RepID=UPI000B517980|nr:MULTISPECIES: aldo/keto reductase [unclassified Achromobacter]OWT77489.1 aldo/keto reductase [Achromobacter sp. HZ28]OWT78370.1 aldo/keto reductase [Achromobacter sp. HZ34]